VVLARQRDQTAQILYLALSLLLAEVGALQQLVLALLVVLGAAVDIQAVLAEQGLLVKEIQVGLVFLLHLLIMLVAVAVQGLLV